MQITLIDCIIPLGIGCCRDFPYLPAGQSLIEMELVKYHPNLLLERSGVGTECLSPQGNRPIVRVHKIQNCPDGGALACAIFSDQAYNRPRRNGEGDMVEQKARILFGQILYL